MLKLRAKFKLNNLDTGIMLLWHEDESH
jgi:hypothetical protein